MIINTLYTSLLFLLVTSISFAKEINITSNELMIDRENKISTFYGDVYVFEDDMEIWADQLTIKLIMKMK